MRANTDDNSFIGSLDQVSDDLLLTTKARIEVEMNKRGLVFSVGGIGEALAISYFGKQSSLPNLQAAPKGTKNIDAISRNGDRFSIKTRMKAKKTGTIYPDSSDKSKQLFEFMLVVEIDENYRLQSIHQLASHRWANQDANHDVPNICNIAINNNSHV